MIDSLRTILTSNPLRRLHRCDSGAALTEFAITLPVYVVFMVGIITMYEIHQGVLVSEQKAAANLWDDALDVQHRDYLPDLRATPASGAVNSGSFYNEVGDTWTVSSGLDMAAAGGHYTDSGAKAGFASLIDPAAANPDPPGGPRLRLDQIICSPSHAETLMNDSVSLNSFSGSWTNLLAATGVGQMMGSGIRYGIVSGIDETDFGSSDEIRAYQAETQTSYNASAPTRPMERLYGVAMARMEIGTEDAFEDTIAFGWNNIGSGASSIGSCP